jgi:hypothetical protein
LDVVTDGDIAIHIFEESQDLSGQSGMSDDASFRRRGRREVVDFDEDSALGADDRRESAEKVQRLAQGCGDIVRTVIGEADEADRRFCHAFKNRGEAGINQMPSSGLARFGIVVVSSDLTCQNIEPGNRLGRFSLFRRCPLILNVICLTLLDGV